MKQSMYREMENPNTNIEESSRYNLSSQYTFVVKIFPSTENKPKLSDEDIRRWSQKYTHHDYCTSDNEVLSMHVVPITTEIIPFEDRFNLNTDFETIRICEENIEEDELKSNLETNEVFEETLTGDDAIRLYDLLNNPRPNLRKDKMIDEALRKFPNPDEPTELDIDL